MTETSDDPLLRFRAEFPILERPTYLISNSLGAMPRAPAVYDSLATRLGAEIVAVPSPGGDGLTADEERIAEAIDNRTALVAVSHVLFKSAFVLNMAPIAEKCRRVGALLAVDAYQSAGTLPVSVDALGADVLVGGVLKWLCGGPGGAFLCVRPELRPRLAPALTGGMSHPAPFDFEPPPMRCRDDAFRFRQKSLRRTDRLLALADARELRSATPRDPCRRGGTVAVDFDNALEVSPELNARDVVVDFRPGVGTRLSPHFYTEDAELDRAFAAMDDVRESGAWRPWSARPALVT
ncbi:MAG: aminotransferase class V-fold PLP-dependent enzyme [Acidobacteria bacterium]|nr:aminotransferase class V-fold PLP-dependent enzyme [Acidobacteriota bacterium]MCA1617382.1 aminotransferase class V-fold PLP-dependent enzyme [Acidobacteriota bacterium]